jgi:hypothetical protein
MEDLSADCEVPVINVDRVFIELILPNETSDGSGTSSDANLLNVSASVNDVVDVLSETEALSIVNSGRVFVLGSSCFCLAVKLLDACVLMNLFGIKNVLPDGYLKLLST